MSIASNIEDESDQAFRTLCEAVEEAIDRKRRLGQYWVEWDGEKPVKVYPKNTAE